VSGPPPNWRELDRLIPYNAGAIVNYERADGSGHLILEMWGAEVAEAPFGAPFTILHHRVPNPDWVGDLERLVEALNKHLFPEPDTKPKVNNPDAWYLVEVPHQRPAHLFRYEDRAELESAIVWEGWNRGWYAEAVTTLELEQWEEDDIIHELRDLVAQNGQAWVVHRGDSQDREVTDTEPDRFELGLEGVVHDLNSYHLWSVTDLERIALRPHAPPGHQGTAIHRLAWREWEDQTGESWLEGQRLRDFAAYSLKYRAEHGAWPEEYTACDSVTYGPRACAAAVKTLEELEWEL
jgi:hypothetical protein